MYKCHLSVIDVYSYFFVVFCCQSLDVSSKSLVSLRLLSFGGQRLVSSDSGVKLMQDNMCANSHLSISHIWMDRAMQNMSVGLVMSESFLNILCFVNVTVFLVRCKYFASTLLVRDQGSESK